MLVVADGRSTYRKFGGLAHGFFVQLGLEEICGHFKDVDDINTHILIIIDFRQRNLEGFKLE